MKYIITESKFEKIVTYYINELFPTIYVLSFIIPAVDITPSYLFVALLYTNKLSTISKL